MECDRWSSPHLSVIGQNFARVRAMNLHRTWSAGQGSGRLVVSRRTAERHRRCSLPLLVSERLGSDSGRFRPLVGVSAGVVPDPLARNTKHAGVLVKQCTRTSLARQTRSSPARSQAAALRILLHALLENNGVSQRGTVTAITSRPTFRTVVLCAPSHSIAEAVD